MREDVETVSFCPRFHQAIELVGKRWNGVILRSMLDGQVRFNDIRHSVPGLSDTMLAERLKELEAEGLVKRTVEPSTPVLISYTLTDKGQALSTVVDAVSDWADEWVPGGPPAAVGARSANGKGS